MFLVCCGSCVATCGARALRAIGALCWVAVRPGEPTVLALLREAAVWRESVNCLAPRCARSPESRPPCPVRAPVALNASIALSSPIGLSNSRESSKQVSMVRAHTSATVHVVTLCAVCLICGAASLARAAGSDKPCNETKFKEALDAHGKNCTLRSDYKVQCVDACAARFEDPTSENACDTLEQVACCVVAGFPALEAGFTAAKAPCEGLKEVLQTSSSVIDDLGKKLEGDEGKEEGLKPLIVKAIGAYRAIQSGHHDCLQAVLQAREGADKTEKLQAFCLRPFEDRLEQDDAAKDLERMKFRHENEQRSFEENIKEWKKTRDSSEAVLDTYGGYEEEMYAYVARQPSSKALNKRLREKCDELQERVGEAKDLCEVASANASALVAHVEGLFGDIKEDNKDEKCADAEADIGDALLRASGVSDEDLLCKKALRSVEWLLVDLHPETPEDILSVSVNTSNLLQDREIEAVMAIENAGESTKDTAEEIFRVDRSIRVASEHCPGVSDKFESDEEVREQRVKKLCELVAQLNGAETRANATAEQAKSDADAAVNASEHAAKGKEADAEAAAKKTEGAALEVEEHAKNVTSLVNEALESVDPVIDSLIYSGDGRVAEAALSCNARTQNVTPDSIEEIKRTDTGNKFAGELTGVADALRATNDAGVRTTRLLEETERAAKQDDKDDDGANDTSAQNDVDNSTSDDDGAGNVTGGSIEELSDDGSGDAAAARAISTIVATILLASVVSVL
ncbi:putative Glutamic acid alanine rich protein of Trypanosoma [Trypanosoma vivax]|nr:putative Glutamic acid alanine rich protein of Trypanosoma [Trypanosoma vivax]